MALPKLFQRIFWHNNTTPAINEDNLNAMSKGLDDVDDRLIELAGTIMEDVPVIQHDLEILEPAIENIDANVTRAETAADNAEADALKSEGYAVGTQDGVEVTSGEYYQNNAKYYAEIANPPIENTVDFTDIITISDAINKAAKDVRLKVEAVQDLHGYTKPWVGGAGKNLCPNNATTQTQSGVTFTVNSDGSVKANGTATANIYFVIGTVSNLVGSFVLNGCPTGGGGSTFRLYAYVSGGGSTIASDYGAGASFTLAESTNLDVAILLLNGQTVSNIVFKPMIRLASITDPTYEPYENICPITGWDNAKVTRSGKNLASGYLDGENLGSDGRITSDSRYKMWYGPIKKGVTYTISTDDGEFVGGYFSDVPAHLAYTYDRIRVVSNNKTFTAPIDGYVAFRSTSSYATGQIEAGTRATAYEPFVASDVYTISLNGTRYGGILDVTSGVLTLTQGYADLGGLTWEYTTQYTNPLFRTNDIASLIKSPSGVTALCACISDRYTAGTANDMINVAGYNGWISVYNGNLRITNFNYTDAATFKTAMNGAQLVYELATPQTIQLTPTQVYLLYGYNTLLGDCGDISLTYDASGIIHIEEAKLDTETLKTIAAASSDFADFKARIAAL